MAAPLSTVVEATWYSFCAPPVSPTGHPFWWWKPPAGADCAPIQTSGLCYLPNTIQAHASYAENSYNQRRGNDPASCYFSGTDTIAKTDPTGGQVTKGGRQYQNNASSKCDTATTRNHHCTFL
ncbi:unnamed protein product [Fraxinus pennsylvanica]|uniref:X8 domain-containing protein n=1 Tax=Fraxinus pennsylvanica TaxID=56036 RepID=A0AAD1Z931_9LAMI|nr:unnamed protein product [Fraxinus pennsylvanica]